MSGKPWPGDLARLSALGLDETASKRGHNYVTVFIDLDAKQKPVVFVTPGKGKACLGRFRDFLVSHGGEPGRIVEVVCDMLGVPGSDRALIRDWALLILGALEPVLTEKQFKDASKPGIKEILDRAGGLGDDAEQLVPRCLDLMGGLRVSDDTHNLLVAYTKKLSEMNEGSSGDGEEQEVGVLPLLQMIVSTVDYQFA